MLSIVQGLESCLCLSLCFQHTHFRLTGMDYLLFIKGPRKAPNVRISPSKTQEHCVRGDRKSVRAKGDGRHHVSSAFRSNRVDIHIGFQRPWQYAQGLHGSKPDGLSTLRGESGHRVPTLIKKLSATDTHWQREQSGFFQHILIGYINHA